jgi:hypothetical protein
MANGDITSIKVTSRQFLPGTGRNTNGELRSKVMVTGEIAASYVSTGIALSGVNQTIRALGATVIDFIDMRVKTTDGAAVSDENLYLVSLNHSTNKIYVQENVGANNSAAATDGDALVLQYMLVGDAHVADLT